MAVLRGDEIRRAVEAGEIKINPFLPESVGPNSYDLRLGNKLKMYVDDDGYPIDVTWREALQVYPGRAPSHDRDLAEYLKRKGAHLDMRRPPKVKTVEIPEEGLMLFPGRCYLGSTIEVVGTDTYVPALHGRSSIGRVFLSVHHTAGWGDVGFEGTWTLEITCQYPVIVYPGTRVCQVSFETTLGSGEMYSGRSGSKYNLQSEPGESRISEDFELQGKDPDN